MLEDLRKGAEAEVVTDICIVGAGAAGIALANEFVGTGTRVLLLESGGDQFDANADSLSIGESVGVPFSGLQLGRFRGFGGATRLWYGQCVHLDPIDVEHRSWVAGSDWPINLDLLAPYYERAEQFFGLSGHESYDERIWRRFRVADPNLDHELIRARFAILSPQPDISKTYRRTLAKARNVTIALYGHALRLHLSQDRSRIDRIDVAVIGKAPIVVRATSFILCNGGIESARLLLLSNTEDSRGVGNEYDNVGRYYQDHPNAIVAAVQSERAPVLQDMFAMLYRDGKRYFPKMRLAPEVQRKKIVLNAVAHLVFQYDERAYNSLRAFWRAAHLRRLPQDAPARALDVIKGPGQAASILYRRYVRGRSPNFTPQRIFLHAHIEQAPNRDSRVQLADTIDAFGQRRARLDWRLGDIEHRTFGAITCAIGEEFARLGLGTLEPEPWLHKVGHDWTSKVSDAYHYIGATRMSSQPQAGVVDRNLQVHSLENLYICSSSVFPTSGYANPTLTIVTLAFRLADFLKKRSNA